MYEFGKGCKKDLLLAFNCYHESADWGDALGQFNTGKLFTFFTFNSSFLSSSFSSFWLFIIILAKAL